MFITNSCKENTINGKIYDIVENNFRNHSFSYGINNSTFAHRKS